MICANEWQLSHHSVGAFLCGGGLRQTFYVTFVHTAPQSPEPRLACSLIHSLIHWVRAFHKRAVVVIEWELF